MNKKDLAKNYLEGITKKEILQNNFFLNRMYGLFKYLFKTREINPKINTEHFNMRKKALQVNMTEQGLLSWLVWVG